MGTLFVIVILCATLKTVSSSCPMECECPRDILSCGPGVSLVLDGCGCCQVCSRQLNEDCTSNTPCDHIKGLECNFGGGHGTINGICRAKSDGRPCEYNNHIYQNGESFCLDCKHQCTCMDGAVGCVSLHPHEITWPKLDCANKASLVKVHGRCCEQLMISCPEEEKTGRPPTKKHSKEHRGDRQSVQDITDNKNELTPVGRGGLKDLPDFNSEPMGPTLTRGRECVTEPTAWTPCSKSCGTGVSSRSSGIIRNNGQCKLVKETRICEVRPCSQTAFTSVKMGQKCNNVEKAKQPAKLFHAGCHSLKTFRPRYCGVCSDGRCCSPHQTHTVHIRFRCEDGETFSKNVMMIQSCKCDFNCSHSNNNPSVLYRLLNDIHKSYG